MPEVEPRRRVDRAERAGGQDDDEPEDAVDDRHRGAVRGAEQKAPAARLRLRAGADDRQVDRDHRQDARRQVQREAAEQHEQQNGERAAPFEQAARLDAGLGVANEREEVGRAEVAARRAGDREAVEEGGVAAPGRHRRRWLDSLRAPGAPRAGSGFSPVPNLMLPNASRSAGSGLAAAASRTTRMTHWTSAVAAGSTSSRRTPDSGAGPGAMSSPAPTAGPASDTCTPTRNSRSNTESGWSAPACTRSIGWRPDDLVDRHARRARRSSALSG